MVNKVVNFEVPYAYAEHILIDLKQKNKVYILDSREKKEFNISHIQSSRNVGYDNFDLKTVNDIPKGAKIYVYCSIGYRSGKIAEKLLKNGYTNVFNVYGGIFNWANNGYPLVNSNGNTTKVHGYDSDWQQWLNSERCIKITN